MLLSRFLSLFILLIFTSAVTGRKKIPLNIFEEAFEHSLQFGPIGVIYVVFSLWEIFCFEPTVLGKNLKHVTANGRNEILVLILDHNPDITLKDITVSMFYAALHDHPDTIEIILEKRQDTGLDEIRYTLDAAAWGNCCKTIKFLLERFPDMPLDMIKESLATAKKNKHTEATKILERHLKHRNLGLRK